ncbi:UvrD/REP helicase N-terminal domain-containing protein [Pedobacter suwonensis]|uniref:DNA 3'-5' helicase n=1 Tax=Pedobacter suwonensis TaxID=332999 RepID=A0A1I0SNW8_9SPHI|nr:UvrD-helicase domain-containing protein [Pedobacter suwonensis]SFA41189.1 UvrD/REP helicase N-terminal domain-containing protein [Pedobacter suwonensis]
MEWTRQQKDIINSSGNIKINAVAGSGKTTTIIEYAATRPPGSRILYLAFNKAVKNEAAGKFRNKGLQNVTVETAHSLAFRHVVMGSKYRVKNKDYTTDEILRILELQSTGEQHSQLLIANHILKLSAYFCNSDQTKIQQLKYVDLLEDDEAKTFVGKTYDYIVKQTRIFLGKMDKAEIEITHDFYLKKFQLQQPQLGFDYILFDEAQDASPAMLDIFLKQKATKVMVGDTHQQIYGWRYAVNSLQKANFKTYHLSMSFRFGQDIANLAMETLRLKNLLEPHRPMTILGKGRETKIKTNAVIARTNLGLLVKAIEYVTERKNIRHIYFEGNINSYTYADEGASLYDILSLYNANHDQIRDPIIRSMGNLEDLETYVEQTADTGLSMMIELVRLYGNSIPGMIKAIKEKHVPQNEKAKAEIIFSTVHRCKGMEYDAVLLADDFVTEDKIRRLRDDKNAQPGQFSRMNEEINLLYVAITRAKNGLYIPDSLLPKHFPASPKIYVIASAKQLPKTSEPGSGDQKKGLNIKPVSSEKHLHAANQSWTVELDNELTIMFADGYGLSDLSLHFGRSKTAISMRIKRLGLEDLYY